MSESVSVNVPLRMYVILCCEPDEFIYIVIYLNCGW